MKKAYTLFLFFLILSPSDFIFSELGGNSDAVNNLSISQTPQISAGAEFSFKLQRAINSGSYPDLQVKNSFPVKKTGLLPETFTIEGINFEEEAGSSGFFHVPPDPHGAAGPSHVVSIVNTSIQWFTKSGVMENIQRLGKNDSTEVGSFFESLSPLTSTFDPKVIYDQYDERFVVVALEVTEDVEGVSERSSRIFVAVSDDDNPNGTWYFHEINSKINIDTTEYWADYPGLAVDDGAVYITANMFEFGDEENGYGGVRLWIINKTPFYSGGSSSHVVYDPYAAAGIAQYASTTQPSHMFGTPPGNVGTFLTYYSGLSDGTLEYVGVITVNDPLGVPSFSNQFVLAQNIDLTDSTDLPDAPQKDTSVTIEVNDRRALNAVWRNNSLWITTTLLPPAGSDAGQTTAHWFKINTTVPSTFVVSDQGNLGGEDIAPGTYTFFPSLAVNEAGDMIIGFSASAPTIYVGAYFAGRLSTDPAGVVGASRVLREGVDYYVRTFGGSRNRWGDYSGISVDPSDGTKFWVFNEYALTRGNVFGGEDGRWGTAFGEVPISVVDVNGKENLLTDLSFELFQNYPNPFNPRTTMRYEIGGNQFVTLKIYDILGNEIAVLIEKEQSAGKYEVEFDAAGYKLSSGVYFYQLKTVPIGNSQEEFISTKKFVLLK